MTVTVLYSTKASATGGRDGRAETSDGSFAVDLSTPKELGGAGGGKATTLNSFLPQVMLRVSSVR